MRHIISSISFLLIVITLSVCANGIKSEMKEFDKLSSFEYSFDRKKDSHVIKSLSDHFGSSETEKGFIRDGNFSRFASVFTGLQLQKKHESSSEKYIHLFQTQKTERRYTKFEFSETFSKSGRVLLRHIRILRI
jgi:hypothetical protein